MLFLLPHSSAGHFLQPLLRCRDYCRLVPAFLCLLCCFSVSLSHAEGNYNTGAFYFANGDYLSAMSIWAPLAQQGNPAAQYSMGLLYDQGKGVEKNPQLALSYFQSAAAQNLPEAQYYLGVKYYAGMGVKKDANKARQLLTQAAQQDHLQAQFQLGLLYDQGDFGIQDSKQATEWFTKAAESGYGPAQHSLASHYLTGRGVPLDMEQGIFWLRKATEQNDADAMRDLGFLYFKGMGVDKDYRKAHDLLLVPAGAGSAMAQFLLAEIYANGGHGMTKNRSQAKKWYQLAKRSGNPQAQQRLQSLNAKTAPPKTKDTPSTVVHKQVLANTRLTQDAERFQQLKDDWYTLQIVQAQRHESISQLTERYTDEQTYFFQIEKQGQALFILLYGHYRNYSDAKNAVASLPEAFQLKSTPWIRQTKAIKALMP